MLCSHDVKVMASGVFDVDHWHCYWHCKSVHFSLMVDESTEKKSDIRRGMLVPVRFFDPAIACSDCVTRLLDSQKVHSTEARHSLHTQSFTINRHDYCILLAMHSQH